eukprot:COSAG02_NODE_106_length_36326_cov_13.777266_32_plen_311_part_00
MDEVAALEQLKSLHQRKTQQIEHVKTLTAEFRQWRGDFTGQLGAQREDMQNMRKQLHEDALKQRAEFQEMQAELQRQLEDLISSNLSAFPVLEPAAGQPRPGQPPDPPEPHEPEPPPPLSSSSRHPPAHSGTERRASSSRRKGSGQQVGSRTAPVAGAQDSSLAVKLSHELGIPVELLAASSSSRPAPLPAEPEPRRAPLQRETAADAPPRTGTATRRIRSRDTDDESTASSRYSGDHRSARSDSGSSTSSAYSDEDDDDASDYSDYSSGTSGASDRSYSSYSDSDASSYSGSVRSSHSRRGSGSRTGRR